LINGAFTEVKTVRIVLAEVSMAVVLKLISTNKNNSAG
jgi:hypothetical protein